MGAREKSSEISAAPYDHRGFASENRIDGNAGRQTAVSGEFWDSKNTPFYPVSARGKSKNFPSQPVKKSEFQDSQRRGQAVIDNGLSASGKNQGVIDNGIPRETREKLAMLRLEFETCAAVQDWRGRWWARLPLDDRRLVLALCGQDDSEESAARA